MPFGEPFGFAGYAFATAPPFVMTLWPPLLMGLYAFSHRKEKVDEDTHGAAGTAKKEDHHG